MADERPDWTKGSDKYDDNKWDLFIAILVYFFHTEALACLASNNEIFITDYNRNSFPISINIAFVDIDDEMDYLVPPSLYNI